VSTVETPQTAVHYVIDGDKSSFTVRAFAAGLLSSFGHNPTISIPDFKGEIFLNPDNIEKSSMRLVIRSASLAVTDDIREKDRAEINKTMHEEVLESESYPEIIYECSGLSATKMGEGHYWGTMNGKLTLRGIQRSQPVATRISVSGDDLRATGDFSVKQSDYEIRPVSAVGGTIKLKDDLKFSFEISAYKQD